MVWAVVSLRTYLEGSRFTVRTDNEAVKWLFTMPEASGKLGPRRLHLLELEVDIVHHTGIKH